MQFDSFENMTNVVDFKVNLLC
ncbi:hypothetical protein VCHA35O137_120134 [Vibrio chagasii]|nr:hypothetical protein VCHA35O137_120134 [Vibrio chagasii]CAH6841953.1 hypothetical protein VCHA34P114_10472 [Vibrio chagasii]CAH6930180.1 hypothetical protein VCHA40O235_130095 [Vibrio chagasii]CAH7024048.1 hypothetical protein VCHA31O73_50114 [Vibrio chagasii]CAH7162750.1 hypothetical protein VCHA48O429_120134 [Vibrio chagasii]